VQAASLHNHVHAIARTVDGTIGAYCRAMNNGLPVFAYNAYSSFPTASTIKMLIMTTAFRAEELSPGALDERITTSRSNLISGSDFMSQQADGAVFTVRQLITPMIQLSDNTASNALIGHFGTKRINATGYEAGLKHTHLARKFLDYSAIVRHQDNVTTPADMAHLLYEIERGAREGVPTVVSSDHCRSMIDIMLGQTDRDGIPAALPYGTQIANKTGAIEGSRSDVAIIEPFGLSPYVLTVYGKNLGDVGSFYAAMHRLTKLSYALVGRSEL
jgi:beta-lactamase class A